MMGKITVFEIIAKKRIKTMGEIYQQEVEKRKEWDTLLQEMPFCALQQSWSYGQLLKTAHRGAYRYKFCRGSRLVALVQILERRFFAGFVRLWLVQRGPVWAPDTTEEEKQEVYRLLQAQRRREKTFLLMTPEDPDMSTPSLLKNVGGAQVMTAYCPGRKWLPESEELLRASLSSKWRNQLRKAEKAKLSVSLFDGGQNFVTLADYVEEDRKLKKYKAFDARTQVQLAALTPRKERVVFVVKSQGEPVAMAAFYSHGKSATYQMGWSNAKGRDVCAMNLLLWRAMVWLRKKQVTCLDLGGLNTSQAQGLAHFKAGMRPEIELLSGTWLLR